MIVTKHIGDTGGLYLMNSLK